jgi:general stress protein 26
MDRGAQVDERSEHADWSKVGALIWDIRVGLLTTVDAHGGLRSRPIETLQVESDRVLWFFTDWSSSKVIELAADVQVGLGYAGPGKRVFVSVSGTGTVLRDAQKAKELWTPEQSAFYPEGPQDPRLALLRVRVLRAEYWFAPGRLSYLVAAAQASITGEPAGVLGENRKVT